MDLVRESPQLSSIYKLAQEQSVKACDGQVEFSVLQKISIVALCKFMTVSEDICKANLDLMFQCINGSHIPRDVKKNIIVAMGDFIKRSTNLVAASRLKLFEVLRDPEVDVRKQMLIVLA